MYYTSPEVYKFISEQTGDPILEWKTCTVSGTKFPITQKDLEFYDKISPIFNGKKYQIPTPTLCPEERQRRRLAFRNERKLYRRTCDATKKSMISIYNQDSACPVYDHDIWWGDSRDAMKGDGYKQSAGFMKQYKDLLESIPQPGFYRELSEGSQYTNNCNEVSDCYLCFSLAKSANSLYTDVSRRCNNCVDISNSVYCERSYDMIDSIYIDKGMHVERCSHCTDIARCLECMNCTNCFMCVGLKDKQYCIFNKQYCKEEYFAMVEAIKQDIDGSMSKYETLIRKERKLSAMNNEGATDTYGNFSFQSNKSVFCFDAFYSNENKYIYLGGSSNNCYDCNNLHKNSSYIYDSHDAQGNFSGFLNYCKGIDRSWYLSQCYSCKDCFGCVGLRNAQYCIFNTQYTKEQYEALVSHIIKQMQQEGTRGEFFDPSVSMFGYNETVAQECFPSTREQAVTLGYNWSEYEKDTKIPTGTNVIQPSEKTSQEWNRLKATDDILHQIIICEVSGKPFRVVKQELEFYRRYDISIPTTHPDIRHRERVMKRPGRILYLRKCDKTGEEIVSVYPFDYEGKVYGEDVYRNEIYG